MGVKIKNIDRLLSKFKQVGSVDLKPVITECTLLVEAQAKALCPVNTGDLRGSIHPEVKESKDMVYGRVYTQKWYAPYVEFGTGPKGNGTYPYKIKGFTLKYRDTKWCYPTFGGGRELKYIWTNGQKAQPYMYPALEVNKKRIQNKINDAIKEHISKSYGGGNNV